MKVAQLPGNNHRLYSEPLRKEHFPSVYFSLITWTMLTISNKSSARALLNLPHDISRQILNDVPLYRALAMAACLDGTEDGQSFKELLLSLPLQKTVFPDEAYLTYMISLYKLYNELLQSTKRHTKRLSHPTNSALAMNLGCEPSFLNAPRWEHERASQRNWLLYRVWLMLLSLGWSSDNLPPAGDPEHYFTRSQDPHLLLDRYKVYWQAVKKLHLRFATKRQSQIQTLADLFRKYPTYLKKSSDPGFEARLNHSHVVNHLESCAKRYRKDILQKRYIRPESYLYRHEHLPFLPLDRYLLLFVYTLARYPYDASFSDPKVETPDIARLLISSETPPQSLVYPPYIKDEIDRVISGLACVYTSKYTMQETAKNLGCSSLLQRTKFTVYSAAPEPKQAASPACEICHGE